jgi:hypothetical protein
MSRPVLPARFRHRLAAAGLSVIAATGSVQAARSPEWREVQDPHFGEVLFYFYQQKYFSAVTQLMTSQHFERLSRHRDEAELLRGGMLLSYGLHVEAGQIFERLIDQGAAPAVRDRAWFYLAKIRYQRGYAAEAEAALARIGGALPGELEDERRLLHANLLMQRGQYPEAAALLARLDGKSEWGRYGRYNLGVALIKSGEAPKGVALLEQLGREKVTGEERAALKDKANAALGYAALQAGEPARARTYFERVRLTGLLANKALLGMGWAHAALSEHERALVPWAELYQRDVFDPAVQESLLAVPYALGKLGSYRQALVVYQAVITEFSDEIERLDRSINTLRRNGLQGTLQRLDSSGEAGWLAPLPVMTDLPESRYLAPLLASHDFQEAMKNYRDLQFVVSQLDRWRQDIGSYNDMLATRRQAFATRLPRVMQSAHMRDFSALTGARDRYAAELERIEREADAPALAIAHEQALLGRLQRIQQQLAQQVSADPALVDKHRLLEGVLLWDLHADFRPRLWQAQKALKEVDVLLAETARQRDAVVQAQTQGPQKFADFDARLQALAGRFAPLKAQAQALVVAQETHLGDLAVAELAQQRERLVSYLTQARFAVAQIYDQSGAEPPEAP